MPKSKEFVDTSSDSDSDEPKQKKQKKEKPKKEKPAAAETNDKGEEMIALSKMRFVSASMFHGKKMVNIREYYNDKDGELKPGRKGISLSMDQWEKLKAAISRIDELVADL